MNTQAPIQATSSHSRWHFVSSTSQIPFGKYSRDTTCIRIPYVYFFFHLYLREPSESILNHPPFFFWSVFKRGKSTPILGSFHASDIPEFFGYDVLGFGIKPDFIGTDALGMFFFPRVRPLYVCMCCADLTPHGYCLLLLYTIQSISPILVIPISHTTQTVFSPMWIGNHGVRQPTIRFWVSSTLLRKWASHSTISEYRR